MGLYEFDMMFANKTIILVTINEAHTPLIVNGHCLILYYHLDSKDSFIKHLSDNFRFEVVTVENSSSAPLV